MARKLLAILALSVILAVAFADTPSLVIEVFRHGARGPIVDKFDKTWKEELGQLTGVGMRQHYLLGVALKERYPSFFEKYDPSKIYVRSTDVNRTIMSAHAHLYGIYKGAGLGLEAEVAKYALPPYDSPVVEDTAKKLSNDFALPNNFQVLPIHVQTRAEDFVLRGPDMCPKTDAWAAENLKDDETKEVFEKDLADLTAHLADNGIKVDSISDLATLGDLAIANRFEGREIPGKIEYNTQHYESVKFAAYWQFFKKLTAGKNTPGLHSLLLLNEIKRYINASSTGESPLKYVFLSAHDSTLAPLLAAFDVTTTKCLLENFRSEKEGKGTPHPHCEYPIFASNLMFEFYEAKDKKEASVAFYYNGVAVPFCGKKEENSCTLAEFYKYVGDITNNYTVEDFNRICEIPAPVVPKKSKFVPVVTGIFAFVAVVLLIAVIGSYVSLKQKREAIEKRGGGNQISLVNNEI